ncbi:MAG: N-6 DNA methylase [Gemmataceae bacterium]|nr:N-6 DNA methylase [Gemmataceae bacterium]
MLLTGFDSKFLNALYVDKNLKHHGLIQAFSRTNRVLNGAKPYGNVLDFRGQQDAVDAAIALFSGAKADKAREIWLVDKAPQVIEKLKTAVTELNNFMASQKLEPKPEAVPNLKGDDARAAFINKFKEVQRLQTQLDQYTDLTPENKTAIESILSKEKLKGFRGAYIETAQRLTKLLKDGSIDTVIGLPTNLFYSTGIPVCILVLKKCKKPDDVLFINAAEHFEKGKRQNQLTEEHIGKIIDTYQHRKEEPRYSRRVEMTEIEKNDFNLNISRYVSTAEAEEDIDLAATHGELVKFEKGIQAARDRHNKYLKELGLPPLP